MKLLLIFFSSFIQGYQFPKNHSFDIVYINLDWEEKRRSYMERILSAANCNYSRFSAVDGRAIKNKSKKLSDYFSGLPLTYDEKSIQKYVDNYAGTIGCSKSHWIINEIISASDSDKPVLILEDDIKIEYNFVEEIENTLKEFEKDWDIIFISSWINFDPSEIIDTKSKLGKLKSFLETYSYLVNGKNAASKIAKIIKNCPPMTPIDVLMSQNVFNGNINAYGRKPALCSQHSGDVFETRIETSNNAKRYFPIKMPLDKYLDQIKN